GVEVMRSSCSGGMRMVTPSSISCVTGWPLTFRTTSPCAARAPGTVGGGCVWHPTRIRAAMARARTKPPAFRAPCGVSHRNVAHKGRVLTGGHAGRRSGGMPRPDAPWGELLPQDFSERDAVDVARDLLGAVLVRGEVALRVTETEAYVGPHDTA